MVQAWPVTFWAAQGSKPGILKALLLTYMFQTISVGVASFIPGKSKLSSWVVLLPADPSDLALLCSQSIITYSLFNIAAMDVESLRFGVLPSDVLIRPVLLGPVVLIAAYILYSLFVVILRPTSISPLAATVPIVGAKPGEWFPILRARWRNGIDIKPVLVSAYQQHKNESCLLPVLGMENMLLLPPHEVAWYLDQPDTLVSIRETTKNSLQLDHTVHDRMLSERQPHVNVIKRKMTRETGNVIPELRDEIRAAFEDLWGDVRGETREVCVYSTVGRAIGRVTNRVFVGLPLCRDAALLDNAVAYAMDVPVSALILKFVWKPLRPFAALLITLPGRIHTRRFYAIVRESIRQRLAKYQSAHTDRDIGEPRLQEKDEPNDFLQWAIQEAMASGDPYLSRVDTLAGQLLLMNFAAIHTSSFSLTSVLLDLIGSGPTDGPQYVDELRREITEVLARHGGIWDKRALAAMPKLDSVLRESARLNSFVTVAAMRMVTAPAGITTPGGVHIPQGTVVGSHGYPRMHDGEIYSDPEEFRPFRFAEKRVQEGSSFLEGARQAFTTTSGEFVGFGHGRHACPGRFFASTELRLMLAHVVMNYDFEFQDTRRRNKWINVNRVPDMKATVRARKVAAVDRL